MDGPAVCSRDLLSTSEDLLKMVSVSEDLLSRSDDFLVEISVAEEVFTTAEGILCFISDIKKSSKLNSDHLSQRPTSFMRV